jgi:hypothetical protein
LIAIPETMPKPKPTAKSPRRVNPQKIADEPPTIVQGRRNLMFKNCVTSIDSDESGPGLSPDEFAGMAFAIARDNPNTRIYFTLTIHPEGDKFWPD